MSKLSTFLVLVATAAGMCGGAANAADARTALVQSAVVRGSSIYLSDLLPDSSSDALRLSAQKVLMGGSPQPGSLRVFSGAQIKQLLSDQNVLGQLDVPEQIAIRRSGHQITREEVLEAIRKVASRDRNLQAVHIVPESLHLSAHVSIASEDADLRVTRIQWDRTLHQVKFFLVSGADPTLLPFIATAAISSGLPPDHDVEPSATVKSVPSDLALSRKANSAAVLVETGKAVRLHLVSGARTQMSLTAIPLERGALGQTIRVRIQDTGKILDASVVGSGQVEANL